MGRTFAGSTDVVDFGHSSDYDYLSELSVGLWVKIPSSGGGTIFQHGYIGSTEAKNTTVSLTIVGSSNAWNLQYFHEYGAGLLEDRLFLTNIPNDTWTYVGITKNASGGKNISCYVSVGGALTLVATSDYTNDATGGTDAAVALTIGNVAPAGGSGPLGAGPFIGSLGDIYYYGRALGITEHRDLMNCAVSQVSLIVWTKLGLDPEPNISPAYTTPPTDGIVTGTTVSATDHTCPASYTPPVDGFLDCSGDLIPSDDPALPDGADIPFPAVWPIPTTLIYTREADDMNITFIRNNTYTFDVDVVVGADATPVDISAGVLIFSAKYNYDDLDADAVFKKTIGDGITILDGPAGELRVQIAKEDTADLPPHQTLLYYDLKFVNGSDPYTITRGVLNVLPEVTTSLS